MPISGLQASIKNKYNNEESKKCIQLTPKCSMSTEVYRLTNESAHLRLLRWSLLNATVFMLSDIITSNIITSYISARLRNGWRLGFRLLLGCHLLWYTRPVSRKQDRTIRLSTFTLLNLLKVLPECRLIWHLNNRAGAQITSTLIFRQSCRTIKTSETDSGFQLKKRDDDDDITAVITGWVVSSLISEWVQCPWRSRWRQSGLTK